MRGAQPLRLGRCCSNIGRRCAAVWSTGGLQTDTSAGTGCKDLCDRYTKQISSSAAQANPPAVAVLVAVPGCKFKLLFVCNDPVRASYKLQGT